VNPDQSSGVNGLVELAMMIPDSILSLLTVVGAVGSGLAGGLLFAFSTAVMPALSRQSDSCGISAMQAVNVVILNPLFLILFLGTAGVSLALAVVALTSAPEGLGLLLLAGALLYLIGVFGVTMTVNVPLNNRLAALAADRRDSWPEWRRYLERWTRWNHVRSAAAALGSLALTLAALRLG
jgi:uncharacterized membrane protein